MKTVILESGFKAQMLSKSEQDLLWAELCIDVSPVGKNIELFTPRDNKGYFILSEVELKYDSYVATIKALSLIHI